MEKRIHTRTITVTTHETGPDTLLIEGTLRDDRHAPFFSYTAGEFVDPGAVHHIVVKFTVSLPGLEITSAEAELETAPTERCRETHSVVENLVGLKIMPGFTQKTVEVLGGIKGCIHLTNLIQSMASAAVQGQWAYYSMKRDDRTLEMPKFDPSLIVNSCWLWREDGPHYREIKEIEARLKNEKLPPQE